MTTRGEAEEQPNKSIFLILIERDLRPVPENKSYVFGSGRLMIWSGT